MVVCFSALLGIVRFDAEVAVNGRIVLIYIGRKQADFVVELTTGKKLNNCDSLIED
jgi:hypothetical protein